MQTPTDWIDLHEPFLPHCASAARVPGVQMRAQYFFFDAESCFQVIVVDVVAMTNMYIS